MHADAAGGSVQGAELAQPCQCSPTSSRGTGRTSALSRGSSTSRGCENVFHPKAAQRCGFGTEPSSYWLCSLVQTHQEPSSLFTLYFFKIRYFGEVDCFGGEKGYLSFFKSDLE